MSRRVLAILVAAALPVVAGAQTGTGGAATAAQAPSAGSKAAKATRSKPAAPSGPQVAVLETALGNIVIKFYPEDAPKTTANFKKLVREKFYDGTYFHRVIPQFMIQGGDPNSKNADPNDDGMGGPGYTVSAEIKRPHLRGSVATARLGDAQNPNKDSSGSQFFIDVAPQPSLDRGGYTVFGEVMEGMDVVDKISQVKKDSRDNPLDPVVMKKVTIEKRAAKASGEGS